MAISRMQQPRQLYGLGSLVKSIGKTVKKVVKSPIGKAAMLYFAPMAFGQSAGLAGYKGLLGGIGSKIGGALFGGSALPPSMGLGKTTGILSSLMGKIPGGGYTVGAIGSILAASGMGPEEIEETKRDPEKLKIYLRDYYSKTNPDASNEEVDTFVETNVSEYAVGGRVGLEKGGSAFKEYKQDLEDGIISPDTTFNEWLDNNAPEPDYDKSYAIGGRVGLLKGTPKKGLESISIEDLPVIKGPHVIKYDKDGNPVKYPKPKGEPYRYEYDEEGNIKDLPKRVLLRNKSAFGGRIGFADGKNMKMAMSDDANERLLEKIYENLLDEGFSPEEAAKKAREEFERQAIAIGGRVGLMGGAMPMGQIRKNQAGTIERDYRETGGFVPVGIKEKADDVPAMLSKNEFVMTADAVRGMGGGNIEKGAQRLYDQMKTMEKRVV